MGETEPQMQIVLIGLEILGDWAGAGYRAEIVMPAVPSTAPNFSHRRKGCMRNQCAAEFLYLFPCAGAHRGARHRIMPLVGP
jgi:hypothetical protein